MKKQLLYIILISLLIFTSCKPKHFYNEFKTVDVKKWKSTDTLTYTVDIEDAKPEYNVSISIRYQKDYEFSNIWLSVIDTYDNENKTVRVEVPLFKKDGKPYGKKSGSFCTQTIPYQYRTRFPKAGKYKLSIVQLMRKDPIGGISDVGVIIDKK